MVVGSDGRRQRAYARYLTRMGYGEERRDGVWRRAARWSVVIDEADRGDVTTCVWGWLNVSVFRGCSVSVNRA